MRSETLRRAASLLVVLAAVALVGCGRSAPPANAELKAAIADLEKAVVAAKAEVRKPC